LIAQQEYKNLGRNAAASLPDKNAGCGQYEAASD